MRKDTSKTTRPISAELIEKYGGEAPRYTSYPTAPNFTVEYDARSYVKDAQASNEALLPRDLSIYLHIPFCHSLCYFCGCNKVITQCDNVKVDNYVEMLFREIDLRSKLFDADRIVTQIHFGGGTPNFLNAFKLNEILEKISSSFHLALPSNLEVSIEIDPRVINPDGITELANIGFNRFSIGVQDFSTTVQTAINREQSESDTLAVIEAAKNLSDSVNVDLISGLPKQTLDGFKRTLDKIIASGVSRVAAYNFAYLPQRIKAQRLIDPKTLPNATDRTQLAEIARNTLLAAGYVHIGMDHFAKASDSLVTALKNDSLQRNFQGYTTHANTDLIGLGCSAISQFRGAYAQNANELSTYTQILKDGDLPIKKGYSLSNDDILRAELIQKIMCRTRIDLSQPIHEFIKTDEKLTFADYFAKELALLNVFVEDGLLRFTDSGFELSHQASHFRRQIAACFDTYLDNGGNNQDHTLNVVRFSQAL